MAAPVAIKILILYNGSEMLDILIFGPDHFWKHFHCEYYWIVVNSDKNISRKFIHKTNQNSAVQGLVC